MSEMEKNEVLKIYMSPEVNKLFNKQRLNLEKLDV